MKGEAFREEQVAQTKSGAWPEGPSGALQEEGPAQPEQGSPDAGPSPGWGPGSDQRGLPEGWKCFI